MIAPVLVVIALQAPMGQAPVTREAYLMGTRVVLSARGATRPDDLATLDALLISLEQSENDLSNWRDTPFNRLNALPEGRLATLAFSLCELFRELDTWTKRTDGAFDPAVGPLIELWGVQSRARVPAAPEIRRALGVSRLGSWRFDPPACTIVPPRAGRLDSGAFAKGEALDRAARVQAPAAAWMIDLGGQVAVHVPPGAGGWRVGIAHPLARERVVFEVMLKGGSLATSGGSERDQRANGTRVGHILDPRTGNPAAFRGSVVVWHERGLVADILSTALYVMGPKAGLPWAERNGVAACFLVPESARVRARPTRAFTRAFGRVKTHADTLHDE